MGSALCASLSHTAAAESHCCPGRRAVLAEAQEVPPTNTALSPCLDKILAGRDSIGSPAACSASYALQGIATTLQSLCPAKSEHTDSDLAFRVALAAVAVVDCGSKASRADFRNRDTAQAHLLCFQLLIDYLHDISSTSNSAPHAQALQVLRATTFKPDVIIACLRRMFARPGVSPGGEGEEGSMAELELVFS